MEKFDTSNFLYFLNMDNSDFDQSINNNNSNNNRNAGKKSNVISTDVLLVAIILPTLAVFACFLVYLYLRNYSKKKSRANASLPLPPNKDFRTSSPKPVTMPAKSMASPRDRCGSKSSMYAHTSPTKKHEMVFKGNAVAPAQLLNESSAKTNHTSQIEAKSVTEPTESDFRISAFDYNQDSKHSTPYHISIGDYADEQAVHSGRSTQFGSAMYSSLNTTTHRSSVASMESFADPKIEASHDGTKSSKANNRKSIFAINSKLRKSADNFGTERDSAILPGKPTRRTVTIVEPASSHDDATQNSGRFSNDASTFSSMHDVSST